MKTFSTQYLQQSNPRGMMYKDSSVQLVHEDEPTFERNLDDTQGPHEEISQFEKNDSEVEQVTQLVSFGQRRLDSDILIDGCSPDLTTRQHDELQSKVQVFKRS